MLYTATQPEKPQGKNLVLLSLSGGTGFGIYAFVFRFQEVVNEGRKKPIPFKRIMYGEAEEAEAVKRIFDFPSGPDDMLLLMDDESQENIHNTDIARSWVKSSRQTIALVNDVLYKLIPENEIHTIPYSFFETLHHSEYLYDVKSLDEEYQKLTLKLLSEERLDIETSFRSLFSGYVESMTDYGKSIHHKIVYPGQPMQAGIAREFGLRSHKIGLLLNKPDKPSNYLKHLSVLSDDELLALTGQTNRKKALAFFVSGNYYYSYMHTLFANLQFIQTLSLATNKNRLTLIMKMKAEDFEDPAIIDALRKVNITHVKFWSEKSGEVEFDLRPAQQDKHGFQIRVVNVFPTPEPLAQSLAFFSQPVVGTTGELSLFRVLSMGKLPLHEWMILQRFVNDEFARIAKESGLETMHDYFRYFSPGKKASALKRILKEPSTISTFTNSLTTRYNASPILRALVEQTMDGSSELWLAISKVDEAIEQNTIHELPPKWQDIAWLRQINKTFQQLTESSGQDEIEAAMQDIRIYKDNIKTSLLKEILNKADEE
ncbi:hypothetical protein [Endozoicomonas montiporae]|nr:hypothetical protein [Endozoicomonas montiporae]